jgi:hypothetical protein
VASIRLAAQLVSRTLRYLGLTVTAPRQTFGMLATDPRHLAVGVTAVLVLGTLYTITVAGLAVVGAQVVVEPWLRIPPDRYYYWQTLFTLPVFFCGIVLAAGLGHLFATAMGGRGTFEQTFALIAIAATLPWYVTWVVETVGVVLILSGAITHADWIDATSRSGFWQVFAVAYQAVPLAWYLFLAPLAVGIAHGLGAARTVLAGGIATLTLSIVLFVAIR